LVRDLARSEAHVQVKGLLLGGFAVTFGSGGSTPDPVWEALRLPTAASLGWYYGKIDNENQSWQEAVDKAAKYAREHYVGALMLGSSLKEKKRKEVMRKISELSGIPLHYFVANHTIQTGNFKKALLSEEGRVLNGSNGQWSRPEDASPRKHPYAGFSAAITRYAEKNLGVHGIGPYRIFTPNAMAVFHDWSFKIQGQPSLLATLANEMQNNKGLRLMVVQGRYDTQTQVADTIYTLHQVTLPDSRVLIKYFNGGHMLEPKPRIMDAIEAFIEPPAH